MTRLHRWARTACAALAMGFVVAGISWSAPPDAVDGSSFPYAVPFQQGAVKFLDGGDNITITEVRGSAANVVPFNFYQVKGTYTLASHERAMLATFVSARDSADGTGPCYKFQTTTVAKGNGTFTLILPVTCRGWPHVSFYPAAEDHGGSDFGGNYFGTGESVLNRWWGS